MYECSCFNNSAYIIPKRTYTASTPSPKQHTHTHMHTHTIMHEVCSRKQTKEPFRIVLHKLIIHERLTSHQSMVNGHTYETSHSISGPTNPSGLKSTSSHNYETWTQPLICLCLRRCTDEGVWSDGSLRLDDKKPTSICDLQRNPRRVYRNRLYRCHHQNVS